MRSVEGNLSGIGLYAKQVIAQLEQELLELQKQYRNAMAAGTNTDARWRISRHCRELSDS